MAGFIWSISIRLSWFSGAGGKLKENCYPDYAQKRLTLHELASDSDRFPHILVHNRRLCLDSMSMSCNILTSISEGFCGI